MKKLIVCGFLLMVIGAFTDCSHKAIDVRNSEDKTIVIEALVTEERTETEPVVVEASITEVVTEPSFVNPLEGVKATILPEHIQLTVGETATTSLFVTIILREAQSVPSLVLIDEAHEQITYIEASDVTEEDVATAGLKAYVYTLDNLLPNHPYQYALRSGDEWSEDYRFELPSENVSTRVAVFGDLQGYKLSQYMTYQSVFDAAEAHGSVDLHFLMGDIVDTGETYEQWDFYYQAMVERGPSAIFATTIGNHDVKGSRDFYNATFEYENNGLDNLPDTSGYFDLPYARVVMVDTEKPSTFEAQQSWLKAVIDSSDKPYNIVLMHRSVFPIYYVEPHMQVWSEVFEEAGVDLVLSGHDHIYSRTTVNDVTYVVTGSGSGSKFYNRTDPRLWEDVIYDDDNPVYILLDISMSGLAMSSYSYKDGNSQLIDEALLTEVRATS